MQSGVYPVYDNQFKVGATKETATDIADMESFSISIDNGIEEWNPFTEKGWARRLQTAKSVTISVSGKRNVGDTGNDFVAGKAFLSGRNVEGYFAWHFPDGTIVSWNEAVYSVTEIGAGDSTAVGPLAFDIMSNGKPEITQATA